MTERKCSNPECGIDISDRYVSARYCIEHGYIAGRKNPKALHLGKRCIYCDNYLPTFHSKITCGSDECKQKYRTEYYKQWKRMKKGQTAKQLCWLCEEPIVGRRYDARFCDTVCQAKHHRIVNIIRRRKEHRCIDCGKLLLDRSLNADRCDPCSLKHKALSDEEYRAVNRKRIQNQENERRAKQREALKHLREIGYKI